MKMNVFSLEQVTYRDFDFHTRCHENSDPYKNFVRDEIYSNHLEKSGIYCKSFKLVTEVVNGQSTEIIYKNVESRQSGVVRTNCIDCLDRTNVGQYLVC
jgi:hypothetical protein